MNPIHFITQQNPSSLFRLVSLIALPLFASGCQNNVVAQSPRDYLEVTPTQLSKYWVIRDSTLNWQELLKEKQKLNINFGINSSGQLVDLDIGSQVIPPKQEEALLAKFSEQRFNATVDNKTAQPVRVTATIVVN